MRRPRIKAIGVAATALGLGLSLASAGGAGASSASTQAKDNVLKLSDFPSGWTKSKSTGSYSPIPGAAQLAKCLGVSTAVVKGVPPTAYSPDFANSDGSENASDSVTYYASTKAAKADYFTYSSSKAPQCLQADFNGPAKSQLASEFGKGVTVGTVQVTRDPASYFGPGTANVTMFFPVNGKSGTINVELIFVDYITGVKEQTTELVGIQQTIASSLTKRLTTAADRRL
jgi:hypothetical protein